MLFYIHSTLANKFRCKYSTWTWSDSKLKSKKLNVWYNDFCIYKMQIAHICNNFIWTKKGHALLEIFLLTYKHSWQGKPQLSPYCATLKICLRISSLFSYNFHFFLFSPILGSNCNSHHVPKIPKLLSGFLTPGVIFCVKQLLPVPIVKHSSSVQCCRCSNAGKSVEGD